MKLIANGEFAQQVVKNYLATAALDALLSNPFRDELSVLMRALPLSKDGNSLETIVAHKIARTSPELVLESVIAFNESQEPLADGKIWRARYDTRYGVVKITRVAAG